MHSKSFFSILSPVLLPFFLHSINLSYNEPRIATYLTHYGVDSTMKHYYCFFRSSGKPNYAGGEDTSVRDNSMLRFKDAVYRGIRETLGNVTIIKKNGEALKR